LRDERARFPVLEPALVDRADQLIENGARDRVEPGLHHHIGDLRLPDEPAARRPLARELRDQQLDRAVGAALRELATGEYKGVARRRGRSGASPAARSAAKSTMLARRIF